jgi:hypothetical protein
MAGHINLPGQGLGDELANGSSRVAPVNIGGPGADATDPQGGKDLEMLQVTGRYRSYARGFGCH